MDPTIYRAPAPERGTRLVRQALLVALLLGSVLGSFGCGSGLKRYAAVDRHLSAGDPQAAAGVIREAEGEYGSKSQVLYDMDLGMMLHLAGDYAASNQHLERAETRIEDLYTKRITAEVVAFLVNDTTLPFDGAPFEQVWVNVVKALNYALLGEWDEALVEARRIDHRLNVLTDQREADEYREDPFARYLSGILYESAGELNDAFIAYRKAYEAYRTAQPWLRTDVPDALKVDLLRITDALALSQEHEWYQREFSETTWRRRSEIKDLAQVIVISYNGRAPRTEDQFLDLPIDLDALKLVLLTKGATTGANTDERRVVESVLYGLSGRVVRVALPKLVPQKTQVSHSLVSLSGPAGPIQTRTQLTANLTATAKKALDDRFASLAVKAVARAASKFALAEGAARGTQKAGRDNEAALAAFFVGFLFKSLAIATEEADKRSWRTLPDEIHIARLWLPPGEYTLQVRPVGVTGGETARTSTRALTLRRGETRIIIERVLS